MPKPLTATPDARNGLYKECEPHGEGLYQPDKRAGSY